MRERYKLCSSPIDMLKAKDATETLRPDLRAAYAAFIAKPKNRQAALVWFDVHDYVNNKEVVGIAKMALQENPEKGHDERNFIVAIMKWFARCNAVETCRKNRTPQSRKFCKPPPTTSVCDASRAAP